MHVEDTQILLNQRKNIKTSQKWEQPKDYAQDDAHLKMMPNRYQEYLKYCQYFLFTSI